MGRPAYVWTGFYETRDYQRGAVEASSRKDCEVLLEHAVDQWNREHPDNPIFDAWLNTAAMRAVDQDITLNVMTLKRLEKIKADLGRTDVEITVGGIVFK